MYLRRLSVWDHYFNYFGYIPRSEVAGSCSSSTFNFLWNSHTVFHSGYVILCPWQQCRRVPNSSHSHQQLLFFLILLSFYLHWYTLSHCGFVLHFSIISFSDIELYESLCILVINLLSDMVCNFFFCSLQCFCILLFSLLYSSYSN